MVFEESGLRGEQVFVYDTTLRDGAQQRGLSHTLEDKLKITRLLDDFGVDYIEGGWPGANPKDSEYFERIRDVELLNVKVAAFGSTCRANRRVEDDRNIAALLASKAPVVTLVGKSWNVHVTEVLETTLEENLKIIEESVRYVKAQGREVIFDAEHFFDGFRADSNYAIETLQAAVRGGANCLVLCDTNGGSMPHFIYHAVSQVNEHLSSPLGIHTHNDAGLAVANTLAAVEAGSRQVQGTINGYGERCGNADLISLLPTLQLKMGVKCIPEESLKNITGLSRAISGILNMNHNSHAPYVGVSAFAHKGGIHVAAVEKVCYSYEHIDPALVGNSRDIVISELSGRGNVRVLARELGLNVEGKESAILERIKKLELQGFQFENAEGSFELFVRRADEAYRPPFQVEDIMVVSEQNRGDLLCVEATVKLQVCGERMHTAAEGDGPVHALDIAFRKALISAYPHLETVHLVDYKVRILDPTKASEATTRVLVEAASNGDRWSTVGCSKNIIDASFQALADSYELFLLRTQK